MSRLGHPLVAFLAPLVMVLAACGSQAGGAAAPAAPAPGAGTGTLDPTLERPDNLDTVQELTFDGMESGLQEAVDKLSRGEDPTFSCVSVLAYADGEQTTGLEAAVEKAREQCGREIPIAWATLQLDAVEATGDVSRSIGECASVMVALDMVEERFTDPRVDELRTRAEQACA